MRVTRDVMGFVDRGPWWSRRGSTRCEVEGDGGRRILNQFIIEKEEAILLVIREEWDEELIRNF